jgi:hypothetical protein
MISARVVALPEGVSVETLQQYREVANAAVQAGKDSLGVQAARIKAIDILLKQHGGG